MEEQQGIGIFIGMAWLAMFALAMVIILFYQRYKASLLKLDNERQSIAFQAEVDAEERQKEKIVNNLHDEIIPLLTVIGMNLERHRRDSYRNQFNPESLKEEMALVDQTISGIRNIAVDLIPKTLSTYGFIRALENHVRRLNSEGPAQMELENKTQFDTELPFSKSEQVNCYRICLELLNNLQKHAGYTYLRITVETVGKQLVVEFRHDGRGVTDQEIERYSTATTGLGLKSLTARLLILNAAIHYAKETDTAVIHLGIPFKL